jgi:hypothetical protein
MRIKQLRVGDTVIQKAGCRAQAWLVTANDSGVISGLFMFLNGDTNVMLTRYVYDVFAKECGWRPSNSLKDFVVIRCEDATV